LDVIRKLAESPGVTVGEPEAWVRDGASATCFTVSGTGPSGQLGFGAADPATIDWERRVCFDDATDLPILDEPSQRYQLEDAAEPSVMAETIEYRWLPLDQESRKLLDPPTDGLTEVDYDTYVELNS
jgi:hypothetical protein